MFIASPRIWPRLAAASTSAALTEGATTMDQFVDRKPRGLGLVNPLAETSDGRGNGDRLDEIGHANRRGAVSGAGSIGGTATASVEHFFSEMCRTAVRHAFSKRGTVKSAGLPSPKSSSRFAASGPASRMATSSACLPVRSPASRRRPIRPPRAASRSASGRDGSAASGTPTISQSASVDCQGVVTTRTFIGVSSSLSTRSRRWHKPRAPILEFRLRPAL